MTSSVGYVIAFVLACGLGAIVAFVDWRFTLLLCIAALTVLGLAVLRVLVAPPRHTGEALDADPPEDPRLRPARYVYYAGAATIGFLTVRPMLGFTASDWVFLGSLGLLSLAIIVYRIELDYRIPRAVTVGVLVFATGGLLSSIEAVIPYASAFVVVRMLYLTLVWFWLGSVVLETRGHVYNATLAWVGSVALSASGALVQFVYGDVIPGGTIAWGRMTGFTEHFNALGGLAGTAFVPALMLAVDSPRGPTRIVAMASTGLIAAGLLLSGSVGGLLAASVGTLVWLALRGVGLRILLGGAVVLACGVALTSARGTTDSPSPIDRIKRTTSAEHAQSATGGTIYTRLEGFSLAWDRVSEQPLIGVGLDPESSKEVLGPHSVHNLVLGPWFTAGLFGLVGIVLLIGGAVAAGIRVIRNAAPRDRSLTAALLAALVAFVQHGMGEPILFVRYGWFPAALLIALAAQQARVRVPAPRRVRARPVSFPRPSPSLR